MDADARAIFFSFSSKDRKVAETISAALEARGFSCWLATRDVRPGENYQVAIVHAINRAKVLLLVFSSNTNASDEIKKELSLASKRRLLVIPVRVEDVLPDEGMSYELATRQWIDLFAGWEAAMAQLAGQLATVTAPDAALAADAKPVPPAAQPKPVPWKPLALAAVVLLGAGLTYALGVRAPMANAPPGASQPAQAMLVNCLQADPDLAIQGCTKALGDPSVTGATRAGYLKFRGSAHARKFEYAEAVADFTAALALAPKDGQLYFLRAAMRRVTGDQTGADSDTAQAVSLGYTPSR